MSFARSGLFVSGVAGLILSGWLAIAMPGQVQGQASTSRTPCDDKAAEKKPELEVRTYDVRGIVAYTPNFYSAPSLGLRGETSSSGTGSVSGQSLFAARVAPDRPSDSTGTTVEALLQIIQASIAADTWRDNGGTASIRITNNLLIVAQTPTVHKQLDQFLRDYQQRQATVLRTRAIWVLADRTVFESQLKPASKDGSALLTIDVPALEKLGLPMLKAETVGLNNQAVQVVSAEGQSMVLSVNADAQNGSGYVNGQVQTADRGLALLVDPCLTYDRTSAIVTLRPAWRDQRIQRGQGAAASAVSATTRPAGNQVKVSAKADALDERVAEWRTTAALPLNKMCLIGGITLDTAHPALRPSPRVPEAPATQPAASDAGSKPQLYLFIEVTAE